MHAEATRGEERSLEMAAEDARTDVAERNLAERRDQLLLWRRHEGRLKGGDSRYEQRLASAAVGSRIGRGEVDAAEAVHVQVDEAWRRDAGAAPAESDPRNSPAVDLNVACDEPAVDERRLD